MFVKLQELELSAQNTLPHQKAKEIKEVQKPAAFEREVNKKIEELIQGNVEGMKEVRIHPWTGRLLRIGRE